MPIKVKELCQKYDFNLGDFEFYCVNNDIKLLGAFSYSLADKDVDRAVNGFKEELESQNKKIEEEEEQKRLEEANRVAKEADRVAKEAFLNEKLSKVMISSGYNFEGYRITKYSGYISGDDAVQIPRSMDGFFVSIRDNNNAANLTNALAKIRAQALRELKEAAVALDCNAVIGVDFDYITLDPQTANSSGGTTYEPYVICVTANGTAVKIEKEG